MNTVQVSIIVPTFNAVNLLTATIESVLSQTLENFEVIIVNDGSTDATESTIQTFLHGGARFDPRVQYVQSECFNRENRIYPFDFAALQDI
jgi:glycosyltransferase involved in cell wall biosynthesis